MDLLTIGAFARATGLTPKALRLYDDLGLLPPAEVDPHSGYRRYDARQIEQARLVATLRLVGMPLARIESVLAQPPAAAAAEIASYWRQVEADTASRRQIVHDLVRQLGGEESTMATTHQVRAASVGVSHHRGVRDRQQDAVLATEDTFGVADGFGDRDDLSGLALQRFVEEGYDAAAADVAGIGSSDDGTTLTAVRLDDGHAWLTHVGDARAWLVRDGEVRQLTADHTFVADLIARGQLTEHEARSHPHRLLLNRALAGETGNEPDEAQIAVRTGDRLVLTTDGVHTALEPGALSELLCRQDPADALAAAIGEAVERAGEPDNHTALVVDLDG